jgi:hypothetical protein
MKLSKLYIAILLVTGLVINMSLYAQTEESNVMAQFLFPEFSKGIVKMKAGAPISAVMNYNTLTEKVVFEQKGKYLDMINNGNVDTVIMQNQKFIPYDKFFLELIVNDNIQFFIENRSTLVDPGKPAPFGGTSQTSSTQVVNTLYSDYGKFNLKLPPEFEVKPSHVYWIKSGVKLEDFWTEKQLLKLFPEKEDLLKDFIKKNHLKMLNREDVIKLLNYLNEISG